MTQQFKRECRLIVGQGVDARSFEGLKIRFEVRKELLGFPNTAVIRIYNLAETSRVRFREAGTLVELQVGFDGFLKRLFRGELVNVVDVRENPDTVTTLWARDSLTAYANATTSRSFVAGVDPRQMLSMAVKDFQAAAPTLMQGVMDIVGEKTTAPEAFAGKTADYVNNLARRFNFNWQIEDGEIQFTPKDGSDPTIPVVLINRTTGMIGSPAITEIGADVNTILNSAILPNGVIQIQSDFTRVELPNLLFRPIVRTLGEGLYRVNEVTHTGDTRGPEWSSQVVGRQVI